MSSKLQNLSHDKGDSTVQASQLKLNSIRISIIRSDWNDRITSALEKGCVEHLIKKGVLKKNILQNRVPGSFELIYAAAHFNKLKTFDAIICLGCIIKGETPHFNYIAQAVSNGLSILNTQGETPVIFGVLTTDNLAQAKARAGGKYGNKGVEAAMTALEMITIKREIK